MASPSSSHKPRRKTKKATTEFDTSSKTEPLTRTPSFPLVAFLWPARSSLSQWEVLPLVLMAVGLFRWAAGLWGYSGASFVFLFSRVIATNFHENFHGNFGNFAFTNTRRASSPSLQVSISRPSLGTTRPSDTGWRSRPISPCPSGISMISSGGVSTTLP